MPTTIQISDNIKSVLDNMKIFRRETYNEIIERMIEDNMELSEKTKKELISRRNEKSISHEEVGNKLGV